MRIHRLWEVFEHISEITRPAHHRWHIVSFEQNFVPVKDYPNKVESGVKTKTGLMIFKFLHLGIVDFFGVCFHPVQSKFDECLLCYYCNHGSHDWNPQICNLSPLITKLLVDLRKLILKMFLRYLPVADNIFHQKTDPYPSHGYQQFKNAFEYTSL